MEGLTGREFIKRVTNFINLYNLEDEEIDIIYDGIAIFETKGGTTRSISLNIPLNKVKKEEVKTVTIDLNPKKEETTKKRK